MGFAAAGFEVNQSVPGGSVHSSLTLAHLGKEQGPSLACERSTLITDGTRAMVDHASYQVEYLNSPEGIRQNFIVQHRPEGEGPLEARIRITGDLHPIPGGGDLILLVDSSGSTMLHYHDLQVWDAHGDTLEASATVRDDLIVLAVQDANAEYPITIDPITTTPVLTLESNVANAQLGQSLSSAGDVNGDGYSDIIIGVPGWSNGQVGEGRAQVHYGSPNGPVAAVDWAFESDQVGANIGFNLGGGTSVSTAGDVNGDGYSDVIVAAPEYDNGQTNEGRVWVFHGSATGLPTTPAWMAESDQASSRFGHSVNCAGDVNGDGYSDVIIGAYQFDNGQTDEGRVFVYHGGPSGLSTTPAWTAESNQASARFGYSVAGAGDVNGDGFSDVIIGSPGYDNPENGEGRAYVYHGSAAGLGAAPAWTTESNQATANAGYSVSSAGDVNGDGYSDVIVGMPFFNSVFAVDGRVAVHTGSAAGLGATPWWALSSTNASEQFGRSVNCAGDVNGDGYSDVIVGAPYFTNGQTEEGRARVFLGGANTATALWATEANQAQAQHGYIVASAGDVNGDGYSDVIVGVPLYDNGQTNEGRGLLFLGSAEALPPTPQRQWPTTNGATCVTNAGDVNGDGFSDVILGFPDDSGLGTAFLVPGSPTGLSGPHVWVLAGQTNSQYGGAVAPAGDVNGDGYNDVIIGAPLYDAPQADEGRAFVYHGSPTGLSSTAGWIRESDQAGANFGRSVASAGDVNGDGYSDVIIGAPFFDNGQVDEGRAFLYLGGPTGLATTPAWTAESDQDNANFGRCVNTAGDVNGDGYSDVIIGASGFSNPQPVEGRAFLYLGGPAGLATTPAWTAESNQTGALFGWSLASAGDVNGDGYSDVIIDAPDFTNGHSLEGRTFLYHGGPSGLSPTAAWSAESNQNGSSFGSSVASAGDVNGDGYSDVIVGDKWFDNGEVDEGRVFLFLGSPSGLAPTANWIVESNLLNGEFGSTVSGAGDVNGDGFSDVLIGSNTGFVHCYHGDRSSAIPNAPVPNNLRLYNTNLTAPINTANLSDLQFGLGLFSRSFLGHSKTRIAWETRIQGQPFSSAGGRITNSMAFTAQQPAYVLGPLAGQEHKVLVDKTGGGTTGITAHKVRARVRYDPVTAITGQVYGPWRYMPGYMDGLGTHNNVPLPVELLYFQAHCTGGQVQLEWSTATETNSDHFAVQRSMDAESWMTLDRVAAAGNSQQVTLYAYTDHLPSGQHTSYYRLVQVDQGGDSETLPVVAVHACAEPDQLMVVPNPASEGITLHLNAVPNERKLQITDATGRLMIVDVVPKEANSHPVPLTALAPGMYKLTLFDPAGMVMESARFIKQ